MGVTFDHNNKMYVWERDGRFYSFANGQKNLLIDIREEVATYGDFGLLSCALDPNFSQNGFVYLYYVVDRHYLLNFGTANYSSSVDEQGATISRVTRYTLSSSNNFATLVTNSRFILVGESKETGFPLTGIYHAGGDIKFALDGSLLVSCGDGAAGADYEDQAQSDGILSIEEYNARRLWRCQIQNSLNGKIIRINPGNGNGIASNPFFNAAAPRSAQSRVYALGFRNPFRFSIKPNTGAHSINEGNPGVLFVGDVGQETKEEINIVSSPGQNFGWPRVEGIDFLYSSNPLFHPSNAKKPTIEWGRTGSTARVVIDNVVENVGSSAFPFSNFTGGSSIGGVFYEGESYPETFHENYFFAEFNDQWVKSFSFDSNNNPTSKTDFQTSIPGLIYFTYNSFDECIYFTAVTGVVKKIKYTPTENQVPNASFEYTPKYGSSTLLVSFDASSSSDPENSSLTYFWDFGDGQTASGINPNHHFTATGTNPQYFHVTLTVTDNQGASNVASGVISLNNTPPKILSTSIDSLNAFDSGAQLNIALNAQVADFEEPNASLSYKWEVFLYHNDHRHPEYNSNLLNTSFLMSQLPCDYVLYYYKIILTVTDSYGLKTIFQKDIHPNCNPSDIISPDFPNLKVDHFSSSGFKLSWNQIFDNNALKNIEVIINGETQKFLSPSASEFDFHSKKLINGKNFEVFIAARDISGNITKSSKIYFVPTVNCSSVSASTYLSNLTQISAINEIRSIEKDKSYGLENQNDGSLISLNGITNPQDFGVQTYSEISYNISGLGYETFKSTIGINDEINSVSCGSVLFKVFKDEVLSYTSPALLPSTNSINLNINKAGVNTLKLVVENGGDIARGDHGDWAEAKLETSCNNYDEVAPTNPLNIVLISQGSDYTLQWDLSLDNVDNQLDYEVFVNGILKGTTQQNSFFLTNIYEDINLITVQAKDDTGNRSVSKTISLKKCPATINVLSTESIISQILIKKASNLIQATNSITGQSNVLYQSGNAIVLNPGFKVDNGNIFSAKIVGCSN